MYRAALRPFIAARIIRPPRGLARVAAYSKLASQLMVNLMAEEASTGTIIEALREMKLALEEAAKSRAQMAGEIKRLRQRVEELEQKLKEQGNG